MRRLLTAWLLLATLTTARAAAPDPLPRPTTEAEAATRYEEARQAYKAGDYLAAARAFDAATAWFSDPTLLWNAGRAWERAGELKLAKARFERYLATPDLDATARADAEAALARVDAALPPDPPPDLPPDPPPDTPAPVAGYVLLGTGGALAIGGLVMGLVGQGDLDAIGDAQSSAVDGAVTDLTRQEALDLEDRGTTLRTLGIVTGAIGVATAVTGLVMVLTDGPPQVDGHTGVTLAPRAGGLELGWATHF